MFLNQNKMLHLFQQILSHQQQIEAKLRKNIIIFSLLNVETAKKFWFL